MQTCHRYKQSLRCFIGDYYYLNTEQVNRQSCTSAQIWTLRTSNGGKKEVKRHFEHIALRTHIPANLQQISTHLFYQSSVARAVYRLLTL